MTTIKYSESAICPKCKGMLAYDARLTQRLPVGFGFAPNSAKFQVDCLVRKGWRGECMECGQLVFAVVSARHSTRYPKSINDKLSSISTH